MEMQMFEKKVKNIKINSSIERNNFKFIRDFTEGKIIFQRGGYGINGLIAEFIDKNIQEISDAIFNNNVNTQKSVLIELKQKLRNLKQNRQELIDYSGKTSRTEKKLLEEVKEKIYYNIVELRVSLGLSLTEFNERNIYEYVEAVKFDVVNNKYKRLDIESHVINGIFRNEKA